MAVKVKKEPVKANERRRAAESGASSPFDFITCVVVAVATVAYAGAWHTGLTWWREANFADMPHTRPDAQIHSTDELVRLGQYIMRPAPKESAPDSPGALASKYAKEGQAKKTVRKEDMSGFTRATKWKTSKIGECPKKAIPYSVKTPEALAKHFWKKLKKKSVDINECICMLKEETETFRKLCSKGGPLHNVIGYMLRTNVTMLDPELHHTIREKYSFPDLWVIVADLASLGANPNVDCGDGVTPLHVLARYRQRVCITTFIKFGANPDLQDKWGDPPMAYVFASTTEQVGVISRMLLDGAAATTGTLGAEEVLSGVVPYDQFLLLDSGTTLFKKRSSVALTIRLPEILAGIHEWTNTFLELLVTDNTLMMRNSEYGWTLGHRAAWHGNVEACEYLEQLGFDWSTRDSLGRMPVHLAAIKRHTEAVELVSSFLPQSVNDVEGSGQTVPELLEYSGVGMSSWNYNEEERYSDGSVRIKSGGWNPWEAEELDLEFCDIDQVSSYNVSLESVLEDYVLVGKPVMVRGGSMGWKCRNTWTKTRFVTDYAETRVSIGQIPYPEMFSAKSISAGMTEFIESHNEKWWPDNYKDLLSKFGGPYYIFSDQADKLMPEMMSEFPRTPEILNSTPEIEYLWKESTAMPHSKPYEFFFGPPYSGHQPYYGEASWHALLYGRKRWFLWPPEHGFYSTSNTYDFVRTGIQIPAGGMNPLQCMHAAGDILFIPELWTTMDVNTRESIGVSHRYGMNYFRM